MTLQRYLKVYYLNKNENTSFISTFSPSLFYFWIFNSQTAIKNFLISLGLLLVFVILDVWIQYLVGKDIFGYPALGLRLTGPLRDNPVVGIFITKFIFISLTSLLLFKKFKENNNRYFFLFLLIHQVTFRNLH